MENFPNYHIEKKLYTGKHSSIYRARNISGKQPVVIKINTNDFPTAKELKRMTHEFTIGKKFNDSHIIKYYSAEQYGHRFAIIEENFNAVSLAEEIQKNGFDTLAFLNIAIQLTKGLSAIHQKNIIHKDIKPGNILINPDGLVKFTDFGSASLLDSETQWIVNPNRMEGTLAYMSPEQTGRMNRDMDYRTDFYSLGITFYEILCGQLPFTTQDPLELIHSHIAKEPVPVSIMKPEIPGALSDIVMKLLSKNAEDRYQSTYGLKKDLEECLEQLKTSKNIENIVAGQQDIPDRFHIHQKLYGREEETSVLLKAFNEVSEGSVGRTLMLVYGYSGIGKTSLINEVHKPLVRERGYFIKGKFDQFKRNIPYSSFIQAFQGLIRQLLTESDEQIASWKTKLLKALGKNARVIIDVIPEVELILGPQPSVPTLGAVENQNRFNRVFQNFCSVFAKKEHPLVIFLDDLQWADPPTLNLIKLLMSDQESGYLFFIGAYRDNEVNDSHILIRTLKDIEKKNPINRISLKPLALVDVNCLISDSLKSSREQSEPLTRLIYEKTIGNPFFVTMFLKALNQEKLIEFDFILGRWNWDLQKIKNMAITDNVIDLMIGRIQKLPEDAQRILSLAAGIGNQFSLRTLSLVYKASGWETFKSFWVAVRQGLILPIEDDYKWVEHTEEENQKAVFRFLHDRVQQAAYSLIAEERRPKLHLEIGRVLQGHLSPEELDKNIFEIVNHLNKGKLIIRDPMEKEELVCLNLATARKAKSSSAFAPALNYITTGTEYLPANPWETTYDMTLSYYLEKGEIEYLNGSWDKAIATFDEALKQVKTSLERCKIYKYKVILYRMKNDLRTALDIGIKALDELGISLKAFPDERDVDEEIERFGRLIANEDPDALYNLPQLKDPIKLAALEIYSEFFAPAYFLGSRLISIIGMKMTEITIKHGNSLYSAVGYIFYSAITLAVNLRDYDNAYKFGKLALRLNNELFKEKANEALILDMWGTFVCHHKDPLNVARDILLKGHYSGMENGSYQWGGYCGMIHLFTCFWGKNTLEEVSEKIKHLTPGMQKIDPNMVQYYYAVKATIFNLTETVKTPVLLSKLIWPKIDEVLKVSHEQDDLLTLLVDATCRLSLANWYFDVKTALEYAEIAERYVAGSPGVFINPVFHFHQCLAYSQAYETVGTEKQAHCLEKIKSNLSTLNLWANHCPYTYLHQALLVKAELARIEGNALEAMDFYDQAIDSARENGFIQNEAFANELTARFYLMRSKQNIFKLYIRQSHYAYQRWGAKAKALILEQTYPQVFADLSDEISAFGSTEPATQRSSLSSLDLDSVMKSTHAISSEIRIENLLKSLMVTMLENAGAQKGSLILKQEDGALNVRATGENKEEESQVLQNMSVKESADLCPEIIHYVARTKKTIVLSNAFTEGDFQSSHYIEKNRTKSILCTPILYQGILKGMLYLENNLTEGAFVSDHVKILEIIAAQSAISIENATLYANMEYQMKARTAEMKKLTRANEEIKNFASIISHDLRSPILNLKGYSSELKTACGNIEKIIQIVTPHLTEKQRKQSEELFREDISEALSFINSATSTMDKLTKNILALSQLGKREMNFEEIETEKHVQEILITLHHQIENRGVNVKLKGLPNVVADKFSLDQIFRNILSNAINYLDPDHPGVIEVSGKHRGSETLFSIKDSGRGIAEEDFHKVFELFRRAGSSTVPGEGMGLAYVKVMVERHGGEIWFESQEGVGTTFYFTIADILA